MEEARRQFKRTRYHVPFTYTAEELPAVAPKQKKLPKNSSGQFFIKKRDGIIQNTSFDGFCFEADEPILKGTEINAITSYEPVKFGSKSCTKCRATVKWCAQAGIETDRDYAIGVKRIREDRLPVIDLSKQAFASMKVF